MATTSEVSRGQKSAIVASLSWYKEGVRNSFSCCSWSDTAAAFLMGDA